jgi:hypothetical protein
MPRIFMSYRRDDSRAYAGRLYDRLVYEFGQDSVFKDVFDIQPGADFPTVIAREIAACDAVLVVIGTRWLTITDRAGVRRLDDPADFVRVEVETALAQEGKLIIPVLIDGAAMPAPSDLPTSLRGLAYRNGVVIRDDPDFHADFQRLRDSLRQVFPAADQSDKPGCNLAFRWRRIAFSVTMLMAAAIAFGVFAVFNSELGKLPVITAPRATTAATNPNAGDEPPPIVPEPEDFTPLPFPTLDATSSITCPGSPPSRLALGMTARVTPNNVANRLRAEPITTAEQIGRIEPGASFVIAAGPVCDEANQLLWWQVNYEGTVGWTAEGIGQEYFIEPLPTATPAP